MKQPRRLLSIIYLILNTYHTTSAYSFAGKRALVTGSSGRVGSAIAKELARRGASVLVHYNTKFDGAKQTNQYIIESGGSCDGIVQCDFTKPGDILQMMRIVDQIWGGQLDILVNSAECVTRLASEDDNDRITAWRKTIQVNLNAPYKLSRLAHQRMRNQPEGGVIVNLSSNHQSKNLEYMTAFAASKAGLDRMTAGLSNEWSRERVRVNAVAPTFSLGPDRYSQSSTTQSRDTSQDSWSSSSNTANGSVSSSNNRSGVGKVATVENIVNSVLYLCESEHTTGSILTVDGSNSRTTMFRPRPLPATNTAKRPKPTSSNDDISRFEGPASRPNQQNVYGPNNRPPVVGAQSSGIPGQRRMSPQQQQRYAQNPNVYMSSQRNLQRTTSFDNNGSPTRKRMENYRDGTENYRGVRSTGTANSARFDSNTLSRKRMENYRDGTERLDRDSIYPRDRATYGNQYGNQYGNEYDQPRHYATRPKPRRRDGRSGSIDGQTYSSTRSVSQNFANGDPRYNDYANNPPPRLYGTRPPPRETVRREMNSISRTLYNGESQLPEYTRYPEGQRNPNNRDLPKLVATRPKRDPKYKQVTRYLNGQTPKPLVDPTKPRNPTSSTYNSNQLPGYDDEPKRYGGTSAPL